MAGYLKALKSAVTGSEEAPFEVTAKHQNFEERTYPAMKWVCTKRKAKSRTEVQKDMFMTLFAYINGKNEPNAKIEMTVPVTVHYLPCEEEEKKAEEGTTKENGEAEKEEGEKEEKKEGGEEGQAKAAEEKPKKGHAAKEEGKLREYTMGFYIPKALQENPPKPSDPNVFIEDRPALNILTRTFGGYPKDSQWDHERKELESVVKTLGDLEIDADSFYTAGYDPPFKPLFRRNEVWLLKTGGSGIACKPVEEKPAEAEKTEEEKPAEEAKE